MRDAFIAALSELAESDERIMLVTGDLGFAVLDNFIKRFPDRYINAGVAEQNMTAIACGLAMEGHQVYTYSIGNFPTLRCLEQIRNDVCYHNADVKIVSIGGGFSYGQLGVSHFATEDLAIMRAMPNMIVVSPTDPWDCAALTRLLAARRGPAYLRLDKGTAGLPKAEIEFGCARVVRDGKDLTIAGVGSILREALAAAERLSGRGLEARVLAIHTVKPLDVEVVLAAARDTGGIVVVEEHTVIGGLASAIAEVCLEAALPPRRFLRIGLDDEFPAVVGDQNYLRGRHRMDADAIVERTLALFRSGLVRPALDADL